MARLVWVEGRWVTAFCYQKRVESSRRIKFELTMRKYYPIKSRFFYQDLNYQTSDASNYENANSRVLQRYKRSFLRSFATNNSSEIPTPSKIPTNLRSLKITDEPGIFLRKLIKQNKNLKQIIVKSEDEEMNAKIFRYLKYSKNLCSIKFEHFLPYLSKRDCQKMLGTWVETLETFSSSGSVHDEYDDAPESFKRAMETILKFPKLKRFELENSVKNTGKYFPFDKLQERNISYKIDFVAGSDNFGSLKECYPRFKPEGLVDIGNNNAMVYYSYPRPREYSKQALIIYPDYTSRASISLLPIFQNILALDLKMCGVTMNLSDLGQLNSLKYLAVYFVEDAKNFEKLFKFLNKNVAPHKKLETLMLNFCPDESYSNLRNSNEDQNRKNVIKFFKTCSESLKAVNLEFKYSNEKLMAPEHFYEGLCNLKNLQSLSLILDFQEFNSKKRIEECCDIISEIKSLEKLDFKLRKEYQEKKINLRFPHQLKELSFGMNTSTLLFDASKALLTLINLTHLELEFSDFDSQKWKNLIQRTLDKLSLLESFTIKSDEKLKKIK